VLSSLAAYFQRPFSLSDGDQSERVIGQIVSGNYFAALGVRPALGRFFLPEEDRTPGAHPVAVISHGLWRRRFGSDPAVKLPLYNLGTLAEQKEGTLYTERLAATLLTLFGLLALSLAAVGIYGVLSYAVTERTREMGIRLALGASPGDLLRLVVGQGLTLTLTGLVIGVGASIALTRLIAKLLFGVSPTDPLTFVVIPLLLTAVALLAGWIPARRATRVDPLVALRYV
jgi:ABC-type antimicrobial peptide transport system permease subunit